jgi:hypothetical protein
LLLAIACFGINKEILLKKAYASDLQVIACRSTRSARKMFGSFTGRDVIHSDTNNVNTPFISESDVTSALKKLKPKLTAGPDNIPAVLLKDCASVLAYPLQLVFNLALKTCKFPEIWKLSSISPIFKKGSRTQVENYRPISLICNFSKVFESILYVCTLCLQAFATLSPNFNTASLVVILQ